MIKLFSKYSNIAKLIILSIIFLLSANSLYGAELGSASFKIIDSTLGTGGTLNSASFSVSGVISNNRAGSWASDSLPLVPGAISSCGKIRASGTYTLSGNLTGISGPCFIVLANNVTIDGAGFSISAGSSNVNYAVIATSSTQDGGSAYGTTTIQNITFSGFAGGVNSKGNNGATGAGGNGGSVTVNNAVLGSILSSGGTGTVSGTGGAITISGTDLDLSNKSYNSNTLNLSYSGTLTTTNTTLSALSRFIINSTDLGSFVGGYFPLIPGTISSCGTLYFSGVYNIAQNMTGNCDVEKTGVTISGAVGGQQKILTGNVTANNFGVTLSNITVTGSVSTTGAGAGALAVSNSSNLTGTINVTGQITGDGTGSLSNTTITSGGSVASRSVSFVGDVVNNGTINSDNSVAGSVINNSVINVGATPFVFNFTSLNNGTVNGNATFNASSTNAGTVAGDARFNMFTASNGSISFSGSTIFSGIGYVSGNVYDSSGSSISSWIFNNSSSNIGIIKGNAVFNDSSSNATTSTIFGSANFNNSSTNYGNITINADVYSPVVRPIHGRVSGHITYYGYQGLYFNDSATGHGTTGKWDDINNWWTNLACTIHAPVIPTAGDDVIIVSGNISTSTISASVNSAVFQSGSNNGITLSVSSTSSSAILFNASSSNSGSILGSATFSGPDTTNTGTVSGYITRQYDAGVYTVVTDFTHNGFHWIIQTINGASVDLSGAIYSLTTNTFQALNNGIFSAWNSLISLGAQGNPNLVITSPTIGENIKWAPSISWGQNNLCQYKIDGGNYISVDCSKNGSDIPRPSAASHTIFFKSTDSSNNITEKSVSFTYNNVKPVWTSCGSDLLDEPTRQYYYLTSNVGNCTITASTTLRGDNNGGGSFFTVGSIIGSGMSIDINLINVTANGTTSNFNNITVSSSTIASIDVGGNLNSDTRSIFGSATIEPGGTIFGGSFTGNLLNKNLGKIVNSTSSPVTVLGNTTNYGEIDGDFVFNATSTNTGTVNGNLTIKDSSRNMGVVNGDLIFSTLVSADGKIAFHSAIAFLGTGHVSGSIKDGLGNIITSWLFNATSSNVGYTKGDAYFSNTSTNVGTIEGNAYVYTPVAVPLTGVVTGAITYYAYPNGMVFSNSS